jgi:putative transposase
VKTTEKGACIGYDAGKKINGRKRHIVVDTMGLMRDGCRTYSLNSRS